MISKEFKVINEKGVHVRPASLFAKTASMYDSSVTVSCGNITVDGKSPLDLLTLNAYCGSKLTITVDGDDEKESMHDLAALVEDGFNDAYE